MNVADQLSRVHWMSYTMVMLLKSVGLTDRVSIRKPKFRYWIGKTRQQGEKANRLGEKSGECRDLYLKRQEGITDYANVAVNLKRCDLIGKSCRKAFADFGVESEYQREIALRATVRDSIRRVNNSI